MLQGDARSLSRLSLKKKKSRIKNTVACLLTNVSVMILPEADHVKTSIWPGVSKITYLQNHHKNDCFITRAPQGEKKRKGKWEKYSGNASATHSSSDFRLCTSCMTCTGKQTNRVLGNMQDWALRFVPGIFHFLFYVSAKVYLPMRNTNNADFVLPPPLLARPLVFDLGLLMWM